MKVTWGQLNQRQAFSAMMKLFRATGLDGNIAYRISRFCQAADKVMNEAKIFEAGIAKKYAIFGEDQQVKRDERGDYVFKSPEDRDAYAKEFEAAMSNEIEIKVAKVPWAPISALKALTPGEIAAIEFLLDELPDPESQGKPSGLILPTQPGIDLSALTGQR